MNYKEKKGEKTYLFHTKKRDAKIKKDLYFKTLFLKHDMNVLSVYIICLRWKK